MKKVKVFLVSLLTVALAMFSLASCVQPGKYEAESYKLGSLTMEISDDNASYVELKWNKDAVVSIQVASMTWEGTGTWKSGEDKNTIVITINDTEHTATVDGDELILDMGVGSIVFEK